MSALRGTSYPEVITEGTDPRVEACPSHQWRQENRRPPKTPPNDWNIDWYVMEVCRLCRAVRCGSHADEPNRCLEARHHIGRPHRFPDGSTCEIGE